MIDPLFALISLIDFFRLISIFRPDGKKNTHK